MKNSHVQWLGYGKVRVTEIDTQLIQEPVLKPPESSCTTSNDFNPTQHTLNENKSLNDD